MKKKFIPIIGTISAGKSTFLQALLGTNVFETGTTTTTKFICLIKNSDQTKFYHVIPKKENIIEFIKEGEEINSEEKIKEKIKKINEDLYKKKGTKEEIFYMLEIPIKNIKNESLLAECYFMDIPGLNEKKSLDIIKYNQKLKKKFDRNLNDYIRVHNQIEIEIIPVEKENLKKEENNFINYPIKNKSYFHIYFNNNYSKEINRNYLTKNEEVNSIKIIIDSNIKSLKELFKRCYCLKEVKFTKFYRKDISDLSYLFCGCSFLDKLNISKMDTTNVTNMSGTFWGCSSLKEINISNFNTIKVTNMHCLFNLCSSINVFEMLFFKRNKYTKI